MARFTRAALVAAAVTTMIAVGVAPTPASAGARHTAPRPRARVRAGSAARAGTVITNLPQLPYSFLLPANAVALTFDDGPSTFTPEVLDILDSYHVPATFFVLGQEVARHPDLAREIVARGHAVANHSWNHPKLNTLTAPRVRSQIDSTDQAIMTATGLRPSCVRPPYGAVNRTVTDQIRGSFHSTVEWSIDPLDWTRPGAATIAARVLNSARAGSIILLHDGGGNRAQTVAALPLIIAGLQARGLAFVSICNPFPLSATPSSTTTVPTTAPSTTTTSAPTTVPAPTVPPSTAPSTTAATTTTTTTTTTIVP